MSAIANPTRPMSFDAPPRVSMSRLAKVELRKTLDTRAGRWFTVSILGLVLAILIVYALAAPDADKDYVDFLGASGSVLSLFMPILIIMLMTSEASQRNGLVTFTLEPRRWRVVVAKFLAGAGLAVAVMLLASVLAVVGTLIGIASGASPDWGLDARLVFNGFVLLNVFGICIGFAIATLLMNTPAAIVAYLTCTLILPVAVDILGSFSQGFADVAPWIEFNTAQMPLFSGDYSPAPEEWAQIATSGTIWMVLPLVLGIMRLRRTEFK